VFGALFGIVAAAIARRRGTAAGSVRTVLAAGLIPATLLLFGLGASGTPPLAATEPVEQGPRLEEPP